MSQWLLPTFKAVSVIFASSAVVTGAQAILDPAGFSRVFGLPVDAAHSTESTPTPSKPARGKEAPSPDEKHNCAYVSLMGIRQLATGITLLTFARQGKWTEMATILVVLGSVVATTDGVFLSRSGSPKQGALHAIPGLLIALLAWATIK
jgi:hypothetical protein